MTIIRSLGLTFTLVLLPVLAVADIVPFGKGSISTQINPASYGCVVDHGNWIVNAGVVAPGIDGCDQNGSPHGRPIGDPTPLRPQVVGPAAAKPTGTHRWWGSVAFYGDMPVGDSGRAGYITPDPIMSRITNRGFRAAGIPNGLKVTTENEFLYQVPDPFAEVFDGIAIGNRDFANLDAFMKDYSDGSVTVEWRAGSTPVMEATFVHGSPYVFVDVKAGTPIIRTKSASGPEKGIFLEDGNTLGVWTDVAGQRNHFLIVGSGNAQFVDVNTHEAAIRNSPQFTLAWLPVIGGEPSAAMISDLRDLAQNRVASVSINYQVDNLTQAVTVTQRYLDAQGEAINTLAGLMPLQWKNTKQTLAPYKARSARGVVRFARTSGFEYSLPFVGVLPTLPSTVADLDMAKLRSLIHEFVDQGESSWNGASDTYWAGKNYGKIAELAAIARSIGMTAEADRLLNFLKRELEDWFTANSTGTLDATKYFVYDDHWNALLGFDESFGSQQQLNDHHFHYGYFVRAAAEICRIDPTWCGAHAYGPMVELLIRDYAAGRNDSLFPYLRNFDPANGFSWASGHANFALGNNNESTSEAANAYGAIILYGLATGNKDLVARGVYLHASSTAAYWEYWNNIDRYRGVGGDNDNFPTAYKRMTTSIIWGGGAVFSTWFSGAYAHILGIQGLPLNPLVLHIGQHADYLADYAKLGLSQSSNGLPSGLPGDQWRDVWWNILAMTRPQSAINDFSSMNFGYTPEAGETKAHTYQWIHTFKALGTLASGTGTLTSDHPAAVAFDRNGRRTYVAYNYDSLPRHVRFSDGMALNVPQGQFRILTSDDTADLEPDNSPPPPQPTPVATTLEAEDYVRYFDSTPGNSGGAYRNDGVDIEPSADVGGGANVGWTDAGEWLEYDVNLAVGNYRVETRVASLPGGGAYAVYLNNQRIGEDTVAATGGWQSFETHVVGTTQVNARANTLRVAISGGLFNLNWLRFVPIPASDSQSDSHIEQQANGDVRFSLTASGEMQHPQVFVKVNGIQVHAGPTVASANNDGSFTYQYTRPADQFGLGDLIEVRFYHFDPVQTIQVFSPGPYAPPNFNWYPPVAYQ